MRLPSLLWIGALAAVITVGIPGGLSGQNPEGAITDAAKAARTEEKEKAKVVDDVLYRLTSPSLARQVLRAAETGDENRATELLRSAAGSAAELTVDEIDSSFCLRLTLRWRKWDRGTKRVTVGCAGRDPS